MKCLTFWVLTVGLLSCIQPKLIEKTISLSVFRKGAGWFYLSKIILSPGTTSISLTTALSGVAISTLDDVQFASVPDTEWPEELAKKCQSTPSITHKHQLHTRGLKTHTNFQITLSQQHMYYFVLRDCNHRMTANYTNLNMLMDVRLEILNAGSHLGEEDNWLIFPIVFVPIVWILWRYRKRNLQESDKDWAQVVLFSGVVTRTLALIFKATGFLCYLSAGREWLVFEVGYMALHSASQTIMMTFLVFVAFGWTLTFQSHQDFQIFIPLGNCLLTPASMIGFIKMVISVLGILSHDQHDKYHMYDSIPGFIQVVMRLMIYMVFLGGIIYSYQAVITKSKSFLFVLYTCGTVYILSLPLVVLLSSFYFSKTNQQQYVFVGGELLQLATNLILAYMVTSKKSLYKKASMKGKSFLAEGEESKLF